MSKKSRLAALAGGLLLAGLLLTACASPVDEQLAAGEGEGANVSIFIPPCTSILLTFGLAWFLARNERRKRVRKAPPNFRLLEAEASVLREKMKRGEINEEAYKAQLLERMVQDSYGNWWIVGTESGTWYRHDGQGWVKDTPPLEAAQEESRMVRRHWVAGVTMILMHTGVAINFTISLLAALIFVFLSTNAANFISGFIVVFLFILLLPLVYFIARGLWTTNKGDGIILGLIASTAIPLIVIKLAKLSMGSAAYALVGTGLMTAGILLTMFLTRKAWRL